MNVTGSAQVVDYSSTETVTVTAVYSAHRPFINILEPHPYVGLGYLAGRAMSVAVAIRQISSGIQARF